MMADWASSHPEIEVQAQTGHTSAPDGLRATAFMSPDDLAAAFARATAVVCHGGPSTIMEARAVGHVPVVVARDPDEGEHVDGHQMRFVEHIAEEGIVAAVQEPDELAAALDQALDRGPQAEIRKTRPQAAAAIERMGDLLDELIGRHRRDQVGRPS